MRLRVDGAAGLPWGRPQVQQQGSMFAVVVPHKLLPAWGAAKQPSSHAATAVPQQARWEGVRGGAEGAGSGAACNMSPKPRQRPGFQCRFQCPRCAAKHHHKVAAPPQRAHLECCIVLQPHSGGREQLQRLGMPHRVVLDCREQQRGAAGQGNQPPASGRSGSGRLAAIGGAGGPSWHPRLACQVQRATYFGHCAQILHAQEPQHVRQGPGPQLQQLNHARAEQQNLVLHLRNPVIVIRGPGSDS